MNTHAYYQELISGLLDDDKTLTAEENTGLQAHLSECEECSAMYRAFAALSDGLGGDLAEPPESLRKNVMAEIRREQIRERSRRPYRVGGFVAAAAVLALAIGFAPRILGGSRADSPAMTAQMAAGAMFASYDEATEDGLEESEKEIEAPLSNAGVGRKAAGSGEESVYVTMDTEAAAAAESAPMQEEADNSHVIFGAEISGDGELPEDSGAWRDENGEGKLSMSSLLSCLEGRETDLNLDELPLNPVYLVDTDGGVLEIYRYRGSLYYYDPMSGVPCEAGCSENDLIRFLAS